MTEAPYGYNLYQCTNADCRNDGPHPVLKWRPKQDWVCHHCGRAHEGNKPHILGSTARYKDGGFGVKL